MAVLPGNRLSAVSVMQLICSYTIDRLSLHPKSQNEPLWIAPELDELIKEKIHAQDKKVHEVLTRIEYNVDETVVGVLFHDQEPEQVECFYFLYHVKLLSKPTS